MDDKHFVKKQNEFKKYLEKHGVTKKEIEEIFSIEELVDFLNFQFYDIDVRENSEKGLSGFQGTVSVSEVTEKNDRYKDITFESDCDLYSKTVNGRVVGIESTNDISLSIFIGDDYISFAETTIKNQYYNGVYTALREIYHYDTKDNKVDLDSKSYLFEGKTYDSPVVFIDSDKEPIASVSHAVFSDREEFDIKGDAVTSLGITYNLEYLPEEKRHTPSEVKYIIENGKTSVYLDDVCYSEEVIDIDLDEIQDDFEERYYLEDLDD